VFEVTVVNVYITYCNNERLQYVHCPQDFLCMVTVSNEYFIEEQ